MKKLCWLVQTKSTFRVNMELQEQTCICYIMVLDTEYINQNNFTTVGRDCADPYCRNRQG
jgi:hypothetical protein